MSSDLIDRVLRAERLAGLTAESLPESARVLLVEDDEVDRMAFERMVRRENLPYRLRCAAGLEEAHQWLERERFDVVLTDFHLGDGSGLELLRLGLDVPVVVITGAGGEETAVQAMRAGAFDYLVKDTRRRYLEMVAVIVDNARRQHAVEQRARILTEALKSINDAIFITDLEGKLIFANETFSRMYGYGPNEVMGRPADILWAQGAGHELDPVSPGDLPQAGHKGECVQKRWDGSEFPALLSRSVIFDERGNRVAAVHAIRDITDRKRAEAQLIHAALHDDLTGLPNRTLFMDRLETALARADRYSHTFGVIFLDLDRFKLINDSLGHQAGDELLRAIGERLSACLRQTDTVARLGGDEFAILLDDYTEVNAVAEKVQRELKAPFEINGHQCYTSASLGIALSSNGYTKAEDLLRDADIAMYRAKALGRKRQVIFQPHMHSQAMAALHLENDLRKAVEEEQLEMHFQPMVDLRTGKLSAFEALVRWRHPERGFVMPGDFLPIAQETDLSADIGWWVLNESCRKLRSWGQAADGLAISVNLDGRQVSAFDLVDRVESALARARLDSSRLRLEITESMIIHNPRLVASVLGRLRRRGVHLHIDDFGTGYSSLSQLKTFPVDSLKIDRSFVSRMMENADDLEIVRAMIQLAHNLGLEVMAEGIERVDQLEELRRLGCEYGQGYLFARALPDEETLELLGQDDPFEKHFAAL